MRLNIQHIFVSFLSTLLLAGCVDASPTATPSVQTTDLSEPTSAATQQILISRELLASMKPDEILLQKEIEPTFSRLESRFPFGRIAEFTLLADGTLIYLQEGENVEEQQLLQVQLTPEDTIKVLSEIQRSGFDELESYTEMCRRQEDGTEQCIADAAFTILRARLTSGQLREIKVYADFADNPGVFHSIVDFMNAYQHPDAEPYHPEAATLFFSALSEPGGEEVVHHYDLLRDYLPEGMNTQPWATYLEGDQLKQLLAVLPGNFGFFTFKINDNYYSVFIVPWLPGIDYRAAIRAEFPVPVTEAREAQTFKFCPITSAGSDTQARGMLRLVYTGESKIWLWDEGQDPFALVSAEAVGQVLLTKDGTSIVFTQQHDQGPGEIWAVGVDGNDLRQLAGGEELTGGLKVIDFSSDGQLLSFTHNVDQRNAELWAARMDGSGFSRLVSVEDLGTIFDDFENPQGLIPFSLKWIPGTHQLIYDAYPTGDGIFIYVQDQVWMVDADTGQQKNLLPSGDGGSIAFSPNGEWMAITSPNRFQLMEVGGEHPRQIDIPYYAIGFGEYYAYPPMIWSPDSTFLLLALPYTTQGIQDEPVAIWQVPIDGSSPIKLAEFSGFAPSFQFSPDLSRLAYWKAAPQSNDRELHLANVDGSEDIHYVTAFALEFLGWAGDSQNFMYRSGELETNNTILGHICAAPQRLADYYAYPTWLGDKHLLLLREQEGRLELSLAEKSGEIKPLIQPEDYDNYAFIVLQDKD